MKKHEVIIEQLAKEATSDIKSAIESAYYTGYTEGKKVTFYDRLCLIFNGDKFRILRDDDGKAIVIINDEDITCPKKLKDIIDEVLVRT